MVLTYDMYEKTHLNKINVLFLGIKALNKKHCMKQIKFAEILLWVTMTMWGSLKWADQWQKSDSFQIIKMNYCHVVVNFHIRAVLNIIFESNEKYVFLICAT